MGGSISSFVQPIQQKQNLMQMKQMKKQRDFQLAITVARTRDQLNFMGSAVTTIILANILRKRLSPSLKAGYLIPSIVVTHVIAYLSDMAYGSKLNRIHDEAVRIIKEEDGWWFNENMKLPSQLRPVYQSMKDHTINSGGEWEDFAE